MTVARSLLMALLRHLPALLLVTTVLHQIAWALAWDRFALSHRVVVLGALAMAADCWRRYGGARTVVAVSGTLVLTWAVELAGVHTGLPFGKYRYSESVTYQRCPHISSCSDLDVATHTVPAVSGIPFIVPIAWFMMAYAAGRLGRHISSRPLSRWLWAVGALAAWDLILDPQFLLDPYLSGDGWWVWQQPNPHLPGIPGIPLTNYAGWLVAAAVIQGFLATTLRPPRFARTRLTAEGRTWEVPTVFYVWTWLGGIFLGLRELDSPAVAGAVGVAMGIPVLALIVASRRRPHNSTAAFTHTTRWRT